MSRLFDGVDDVLSVGSAPVTAPPFSFACWFKLDGDVASQRVLLALSTAGSNDNQFRIQLESGGLINFRARTTGNEDAQTATAITDSTTWHHIGGYASSASDRGVVLDGVVEGTNAVSLTPSGINRFYIGRREMAATLPFPGNIAHVAIWSAALSVSEWASLGAAKLSPIHVRPQSLVFYAPYFGRDSSEIDIVGALAVTVSGAVALDDEPAIIIPSRKFISLPVATSSGVVNTVTLEDSLLVNDGLLWSVLRNHFQLDAMVISDASLQSTLRNVTTSDLVVLLDELLIQRRRMIVADDFIVLVDELIATATSIRIVIALLESLLLTTDDVLMQAHLTREAGSTIDVDDQLSVSAFRNRDLSDTMTLADEVWRRVNLTRVLDDSLTVYDEMISLLVTTAVYDGSKITIGADQPSILVGDQYAQIQLGRGVA